MNEKLKRLALTLFDDNLILTDGPFKFKLHEKHTGAPQSPIKLNLRFPPKGTLTEKLVEQISNTLYQVSLESQLQYDCVVGVPRAGDPFAKVFSKLASVPLLTLVKEETGKRRRVLPVMRGDCHEGQRVLILDDTVVMADSKREAIESVIANGLIVAGIEVLVDWEHGGREDLEKDGYRVISRFKMSELLLLYLKEGRISSKKYQDVMAYLKAIRAFFGKL